MSPRQHWTTSVDQKVDNVDMSTSGSGTPEVCAETHKSLTCINRIESRIAVMREGSGTATPRWTCPPSTFSRPIHVPDHTAHGGAMPKPAFVGEHCPRHGAYPRPHHAEQHRDQATRPGVPAHQAHALLDRYGMARRVCPSCGGKTPSRQEWAIEARYRAQAQHPAGNARAPTATQSAAASPDTQDMAETVTTAAPIDARAIHREKP